MPSFWLLKSEPSVYSFDDLLKDGKTNWNGVRNFQARGFLKQIKKGDLALFYHSNEDKAVVGIATVVKGAYPDEDSKKPGDWVQIDVAPKLKLSQPVTLGQIKKDAAFTGILLVKQSRLSVMPVSKRHFERILKQGSMKLGEK